MVTEVVKITSSSLIHNHQADYEDHFQYWKHSGPTGEVATAIDKMLEVKGKTAKIVAYSESELMRRCNIEIFCLLQ